MISLILFVKNYKEIVSDSYKLLIIILIFSLAIGVHGLSHAIMEIFHEFNPL